MTRPEPQTIGRRIQTLRRAAGMSQETLAAAVGVSRQALGKWESDLSLPGLDNLLALAQTLGVSCDELLTGRAAPQQDAAALSLDGIRTLLDAREASAAKRRRITLIIAGAAGVVLVCALAAALLYTNGRIDELGSRIGQVDAQVSGLSGTLQAQTDAMAERVQQALDAQDALAAGQTHEYSGWDPDTQTLMLTARVTAKETEPGMQAELVLTAPGLDAVTLPMTDAGGGLYEASGRVNAAAQPLTGTFRVISPDGTVKNQQLWEDYDIAGEHMLSVELTDGIDGRPMTVSTQRGELQFSSEAGLCISAAAYCRPVAAQMALEVGGETVETYDVDVSDFSGEGIADENGVAEAFSAVTHFWTPQPHPWQEGQTVRLTARVEDDQGVVYERELVLLP